MYRSPSIDSTGLRPPNLSYSDWYVSRSSNSHRPLSVGGVFCVAQPANIKSMRKYFMPDLTPGYGAEVQLEFFVVSTTKRPTERRSHMSRLLAMPLLVKNCGNAAAAYFS